MPSLSTFLRNAALAAGAVGALALFSPVHAQIKIGVAGPMTGPNAVFGEQMRRGGRSRG